jgi:crotonobetainyl-CoA:carnitine CoA-transferase CaiB-like acyl-CoA transferase
VRDGWVRIRTDGESTPHLDSLLEESSRLDRDQAVKLLQANRVSAVAVRSVVEFSEDPELAASGLLHRDPRPGREHWVTPGRHARFSRTERDDTLVAPALGQHTRSILREADIPSERIDELVSSGVVAEERRR